MAGLADFLARLQAAIPAKKSAVAGGAAAAVIAAAVAFIAPWEGEELRAYRDLVGVWTICNGATEGVKPGQTATPAECKERLALDVARYEKAIRPCLPDPLPNGMLVAFISVAYNIGPAAFCKSSMAKYAYSDPVRACASLLLYNKAGGKVVRGLVRRRAAEKELCSNGLRLK